MVRKNLHDSMKNSGEHSDSSLKTVSEEKHNSTKVDSKSKKTTKKSSTKSANNKNNALVVVNESVPMVSTTHFSKNSKKILLHSNVSPDKAFVLCDGRRINNVRELADILHLMNDDMFKYHVTDTKNDFANWINDVYLDHELAKKIRNDKGRIDICIELYKELLEELKHNRL